jgi:hypothetical protein
MDEERMRFTFAIGSLPSKAKSSTILAPGILGCIARISNSSVSRSPNRDVSTRHNVA